LIVGRRKLVERLRESPLARALRPGKSTLAGLHATLLHYARGEAERQVPVWRMIAAGAHDLAARAEAWQAELAKAGRAAATAEALSTVGGGSLPGQTLPTTVLAVTVSRPHELAAALRTGQPPVVARIAGQAVLLDPRTVLPEDDEVVLDALGRALDSVSHP
jgi:L-seryl-tRNA(Ser) seleniumtransferase